MCPGLRDETATVRPLPMCAECSHWQAHTGPVIQPRAVIALQDGQQVLHCSRRVPAPPLPEVA